jgi:hypothetical protein
MRKIKLWFLKWRQRIFYTPTEHQQMVNQYWELYHRIRQLEGTLTDISEAAMRPIINWDGTPDAQLYSPALNEIKYKCFKALYGKG